MAKKKNYKEVLTTPFETKIKNFSNISRYFLYYAPNLDTLQSTGKIGDIRAAEVFQEMLSCANMERHYKVIKQVKTNTWLSHELSGEILDFEKPRMIFDKYSKETNLNALLRHIRNALAHGNLYVWKKNKGNFIFMIDYDSGKKKVTAKIMISSSIMEQWKGILENEIATGE